MTAADVYIVRRDDGRQVGEVRNNTLVKRAKREHMLHTPRQAWAWDSDIVRQALAIGATHTEVTCEGIVYRASLADFARHGWEFDWGDGKQWRLDLRHWSSRPEGEEPAEEVVQLSLLPADEVAE